MSKGSQVAIFPPYIPITSMSCRVCADPCDAPGAVTALHGPDTLTWCCAEHFACDALWTQAHTPDRERRRGVRAALADVSSLKLAGCISGDAVGAFLVGAS